MYLFFLLPALFKVCFHFLNATYTGKNHYADFFYSLQNLNKTTRKSYIKQDSYIQNYTLEPSEKFIFRLPRLAELR
jgi:hypothetical protein